MLHHYRYITLTPITLLYAIGIVIVSHLYILIIIMHVWQPIDALPQVLTQYVQRIGYHELALKEVFSVASLQQCAPLGLIFQLEHKVKPNPRESL